MPSGSHSGGSHFGGGHSSFSGGGSHFGGSRSGHSGGGSHFGGGPRGPRGPVFIHWGGHYYSMSYSKNVLVVFLLVISFIAGFVGFGFTVSNNRDKLDIIRMDYEYYYQMVDYAESNSNYRTTATITGFYQSYSGKYYYNYKFKMDPSSASSFYIDGYTYCLYTEDDLPSIAVGTTITIAISDNVNNISFDCDSVPMDIKHFRPEDDGEFQALQRSAETNKKVGIVTLIIAGIMLATTITLWILFLKKTDKNEYEKSKSGTITSSSINIDTNPKTKYCSYCGSALNSNATSCHCCGARVHKE